MVTSAMTAVRRKNFEIFWYVDLTQVNPANSGSRIISSLYFLVQRLCTAHFASSRPILRQAGTSAEAVRSSGNGLSLREVF
jgi:hypothetical protein